jgi:DeoR/GlpR family transcriptional regulator of sugar metabolism
VVAEAAAAVALAVTTDKLGTTAPYAVIPIAAVTHLVVEADATEAMLAPLMHGGIRIHRTAAATGERT